MTRQLNKKGFTLVELLVAVLLMTIGILAVVQMQIVGIQSSSIANKLNVATELAHEVMEDIQSWDLNNPPVANLFAPAVTDNSGNFTLGNQSYARFQTTRDATSITIPGAGIFTATYSVTLNPVEMNTAIIKVTVTGGGRTVILTSHRRVV